MPRIEACENKDCRKKVDYDKWQNNNHLCDECAKDPTLVARAKLEAEPNVEKIERPKEWPDPPPMTEPKPEWVEGNIELYGRLWELYLGKVQMLTHAERMAFTRYMDYVSQPKIQFVNR